MSAQGGLAARAMVHKTRARMWQPPALLTNGQVLTEKLVCNSDQPAISRSFEVDRRHFMNTESIFYLS